MAKKIVIVGWGFAGLTAIQRLSEKSSVEVSLIDQRNYHLFQPLLYQVATAGLNILNEGLEFPVAMPVPRNKNRILNGNINHMWLILQHELSLREPKPN